MADLLPLATLQRLWPHGDQHIPGLIEGIAASAPDVFARYGITTELSVAIMMGQFSEECGAGLEMIENMNYSEQGLRHTFPTHFTGTMAARYAHSPRMIADIAYGGRMGNAPPPSDDGWNYRGAGLSQVTGREGVQKLQAFLAAHGTAYDILANPGLIVSPQHTLECGVADFIVCGCLPFAEKGDVLNVTKHLNGGTNGLAERERWTALWRHALGSAAAAAPMAGAPPPLPTLPAAAPRSTAPAPAAPMPGASAQPHDQQGAGS